MSWGRHGAVRECLIRCISAPRFGQALWRRSVVGADQPARRDFALSSVQTPDGPAPLARSEKALSAFATLSTFTRSDCAPTRRILLAPPASGAFAFLLRDMVADLAVDAEVSVLEWTNARWAPSSAGTFDYDAQISAIADALRVIGDRAHLIGVCQAGPACLAAAAGAASDDAALQPMSLSLLGAPLDPISKPSPFTEKIRARGLDAFAAMTRRRIHQSRGVDRVVYPAETQLSLFLSSLAQQSMRRDELPRMIVADAERPEEDEDQRRGRPSWR